MFTISRCMAPLWPVEIQWRDFWHQGRSWASRFLNLETCNKGENSGIEVVNDEHESSSTWGESELTANGEKVCVASTKVARMPRQK